MSTLICEENKFLYFLDFDTKIALILHLHFAPKLVGSSGGHEEIRDTQVVIDRNNNHSISCPEQSCTKESNLLIRRDKLSWPFKISDV